MKKPLLFLLAACALAGALHAGTPGEGPARENETARPVAVRTIPSDSAYKKPRLIVEVVLGQFRYDYLNRFRRNLSPGGFLRLMNEGVACTNARCNFMFTQSSPAVASLMTGAYPSQHGIIGEYWVNYTTNEIVTPVGDNRVQGVGCPENEGQFSPSKLIVNTLGDELKSSDERSKVVSIALDPAGAVLAGGYTADAAYWLDPHYGNWVTSSYYSALLPGWVEDFNRSPRKEAYLEKIWAVSRDIDDYVMKDRTDIQLDSVLKISFDLLLKPRNRDVGKLLRSPLANTLLKEFAMEALVREELGRDESTDLLVLHFGATKAVSEKYGTRSMEIEDAVYRLDKDLGGLIDFLNEKVGKENYLLVVTADHGSSDTPPLASKLPSGKFNGMQFKVLIGGFLNAQLGDGMWVSAYKNRQLYLNRRLVYEKGFSLEEVQNKVAAFALQFGGIANAVTATSMQNNYYGRGLMEKIQNSYFPKHSGDIIVNLLPGWIEVEAENAETNLSDAGSPYEYDTHVPLFFYGSKLDRTTVHENIDMTDVAPTLSTVLEIGYPQSSLGTPIRTVVRQLK